MPTGRRLDIAVLPAEAAKMRADCYVVIDALRATTMIATLLHRGARAVTVADSEDAARELAAASGALLAGEVGGLPPAGFDLGNSPVEASEMDLADREVVLFTTNGTRAICESAARGRTVAGAFTNGGAIVDACRDAPAVAFICAGNAGGEQFSIEDYAVAAHIATRLQGDDGGIEAGDPVLLALEPGASLANATEIPRLMGSGSHAAHLRSIGLDEDIAFAGQADVTPVVPAVVEWGQGWARLERAQGG